MMKSRHQFRRRFSLQPSSSLKEGQEETPKKSVRNERLTESESDDKSPTGPARYKIVVMGGIKVGKSSIINQFLYNTFMTKYKPTVEEMHRGDFNVSGTQLILDILDTSGSNEFPVMRELSIKSADALILVYDVNNINTFSEIEILRTQIISIKGPNVPIVVVGNKVDLLDQNDSDEIVDAERTKELVENDWENGFVEVSAKDNINISQVFKELLVQAKVKYNLSPALRRRRRQSLPPPHHNSRNSTVHAPTPQQLQHLQQIREQSGGKRNSCTIS